MNKEKTFKIIKLIFMQTCMISFGILLINSIIIAVTHNYGGEDKIDYLFPLGIVICSILCGASVIIFYIHKIPFIAKCIIHFIIIVLIVTGIAIWFGWLTQPVDFVAVYIVFLVIYVIVWFVTYRNSKAFVSQVNDALKDFKDEE